MNENENIVMLAHNSNTPQNNQYSSKTLIMSTSTNLEVAGHVGEDDAGPSSEVSPRAPVPVGPALGGAELLREHLLVHLRSSRRSEKNKNAKFIYILRLSKVLRFHSPGIKLFAHSQHRL